MCNRLKCSSGATFMIYGPSANTQSLPDCSWFVYGIRVWTRSLLQVYVSNKMRKLFLEQHEPVIAEAFEKIQKWVIVERTPCSLLSSSFDDECTALLDQCFHSSEKDTRAVLDTNYHLFIHTDGCPAAEEDMEVMALAAAAKAKVCGVARARYNLWLQNFLSHPACQREIDFRWQPGFKLGQVSVCEWGANYLARERNWFMFHSRILKNRRHKVLESPLDDIWEFEDVLE